MRGSEPEWSYPVDDELDEDDDGPPDDLCGFCGMRRAEYGMTACRTCGGGS